MSSTIIHIFGPDGRRLRDEEYRNSHTAAVLWQYLWYRYLAQPSPLRAHLDDDGFGSQGKERFPWMTPKRLADFWALHNDPRLEWFERAALRSTYDRCVVGREAFLRLADAFDLFTAKYVPAPARHVWHLPAWAALLRQLATDDAVRAVGWTQTTVNRSAFPDTYVKDGLEYPREDGGYCLDTDTTHWYLPVDDFPA